MTRLHIVTSKAALWPDKAQSPYAILPLGDFLVITNREKDDFVVVVSVTHGKGWMTKWAIFNHTKEVL